jgi:hypothetical protein
MPRYTPSLSQTSRPFRLPVKRRWAAVQGGNRLTRLHSLLVGDAARLNTLPENDPRRRPTLPRVRFLEPTVASATIGGRP